MNFELTRRSFLRAAGLGVTALASGCSGRYVRGAEKSAFVTVRDRCFERNGRRYAFIGANFLRGTVLGNPEVPNGREKLVQELDQLRAAGVTNLRILGGSEGPHGILLKPGGWDTPVLEGLDFTLAEMAKRDMTAVIYLTNYWEWSGGMAAYVSWATGEPIPNPHAPDTKHTMDDHMEFAARFYGLPTANELFRQHIAYLLNRRNSVNGHIYNSDPTIMSWQLCNEPRPGVDDPATESNLPNFYAWIDNTAHFIKEHAPRQLVSTGNEGIMGCIGKADVYSRAHASPAVDYATLHVWVKNWGWLREPRLGPQYEEAAEKAVSHIHEHIALSENLGKPLVLEEFGIGRDDESTKPRSPTTMRDRYYETIFHCLLDSIRSQRALQGANFWLWSGTDRRARSDSLDINGVATDDLSTISVIGTHSTELSKLVA